MRRLKHVEGREPKRVFVIRLSKGEKEFILKHDKFANELGAKPSQTRAVNFMLAELGYNYNNQLVKKKKKTVVKKKKSATRGRK